jgi:hypothetical protein
METLVNAPSVQRDRDYLAVARLKSPALTGRRRRT